MHPRSLGQLVRFCLACRVIAVFTPPRRPASNALVERYNGLWQEKVWQRYRFRTLGHLRQHSQAFQKAYNTYLKRRLIRKGKSALFQASLRYLPKKILWAHPLPLCRARSGLYGESRKMARSRSSTKRFGSLSDTPMNSCGWLSEPDPRASRYTGGIPNMEDSN